MNTETFILEVNFGQKYNFILSTKRVKNMLVSNIFFGQNLHTKSKVKKITKTNPKNEVFMHYTVNEANSSFRFSIIIL